jgi:hypothetical protein
MEGCGLCGGQLDDHNVRVTVQFGPGLRNGRHFTEVPYRLEDWALCWKCFTGDECKALRAALEDEYTEPVIAGAGHCRTVCESGLERARGRVRRFFSLRQGSIGEPEKWARCPVCLGPCEVERAA